MGMWYEHNYKTQIGGYANGTSTTFTNQVSRKPSIYQNKDARETHGLTLGDLVARLIKERKEPLADFAEGYRVGYASAVDGERIEVNCCYCGRPIKVSQKQVIELAERLLKFKHIECPCGSDKIEITRR